MRPPKGESMMDCPQMFDSGSIPLPQGAKICGSEANGGKESSLFCKEFGGAVESRCLCPGLWSPLSTCALQGAEALASTPLLFLLVSTKLLLLQDCRTSVIKNKNESCFIHQTSKGICNTVCKRMQGGAHHTQRRLSYPCSACLTHLPDKTTFTFRERHRGMPFSWPFLEEQNPHSFFYLKPIQPFQSRETHKKWAWAA